MDRIGTLGDLRRALWRRGWQIALVLAIGLPLAVAFALSRPKSYEATAVIQIEAPEVTVTTAGQVRGLTADGQLDLITQHMMARDNMLRLIAEHGLFADLGSETERIAALRRAIATVKLVDPAQAWRPDVQPSGLSITLRLDDPQKAAAVANALLDQIITESRDRAEGRAARTLEFLTAEEARVSAALAGIEGQIATFRATHVDSLPEGLTAQRDRMTRLAETRLALEQERLGLQGAQARMRPEEVAAQEALLTERIGLVDADIATVEAALATAPDVERQLTALTRTLDQLEAELTVLTTQRTEAATAQLLATQEQAERFVVLERAMVPEFPVSTSRSRLAAAGGVLVAMAAVGLALVLEWMQPAIRTAEQMERALGVQPVIVVPRLHSRRGRMRRRMAWAIGTLAALGAAILGGLIWGQEALRLLGQRRVAVPVALEGGHREGRAGGQRRRTA